MCQNVFVAAAWATALSQRIELQKREIVNTFKKNDVSYDWTSAKLHFDFELTWRPMEWWMSSSSSHRSDEVDRFHLFNWSGAELHFSV